MAEGESFLQQKSFAGLPVWAIGLAAVGGLAVGFYFLRKTGGGGAAASAGTGTGTSIIQVPGPAPSPGGTGSGGGGPGSPPVPAGVWGVGVTRAKNFPSWDNTHTGLPVRPTPDNNSAAAYYYPWSTPIVLLGPSVSGGANVGNSTWYPVVGGYMSAYDLPTVDQLGTGNTGQIAGQPVYYTLVQGDSLNSVSARYNTTAAQLVAWNVTAYPLLATINPAIGVGTPGGPGVGWQLRVG